MFFTGMNLLEKCCSDAQRTVHLIYDPNQTTTSRRTDFSYEEIHNKYITTC